MIDNQHKDNCTMYSPRWMIECVKRLATHWFWVKPNINHTVKIILLWQFLPELREVKSVTPLPEALKEEFIALAEKAGDYPDRIDGYHRGGKVTVILNLPVMLSQSIRETAKRSGNRISAVINAALYDYLLSGTIPGNSKRFMALRQYRPATEAILSSCQQPVKPCEKKITVSDGVPFKPSFLAQKIRLTAGKLSGEKKRIKTMQGES